MTTNRLAALMAELTACERCPRLTAWRSDVAKDETYWSLPVPSFGDPQARLLILGLAPGAHGANRTGRPFTGDGAGTFLYQALHEEGLATHGESIHRSDPLRLTSVIISNAVRCVPPENRPTPAEVQNCAPWLQQEMATLSQVSTVLALGKVAHDAFLTFCAGVEPTLKKSQFPFAHGQKHALPGTLPTLFDSFHTSRYNVNVGKLTYEMFRSVIRSAHSWAQQHPRTSLLAGEKTPARRRRASR
ncbi:MAG TPA: uracil-DNA glycosylase [Planctomycetota bacterium]|nr:uracil-DNA glycosylase [Planctomycetota bacterium]